VDAPRPQFTSPATAAAAPAHDETDQGGADLAWLDRIISLTLDPTGNRVPGGAAADKAAEATGPATVLPLQRLHPPARPGRRQSDPEATARLAASITEHGILQPLLVRPRGVDFEIVAGLRRYEAAKLIGLETVPVIMLALTEREALMVSLVENLQRDDLPALDEAQCYQRMLDELGWTQDELARHLGRSRSHIANTLRLLNLPPKLQGLLEERAITAGHARALLTAADPVAMAEAIIADHLTVRDTETLAQRDRPAGTATPRLDDALSRYEISLGDTLGLKVRLNPLRGGGGKLVVYYASTEELEAALCGYGDKRSSESQPGG